MTSGILAAIDDSAGNDVHRYSEFHGQRVIVTGATSGIGAAAARWFGDRGARLLLTGRDRERGERVLDQVQKSTDDARFIAGDLGDSLFCGALIDEAVQRWNGVDVLVNCAGVIYRADAMNTTDAQWRTTLAINASAAFFLCRAALKVMKLQGAGSIVNVASDWGLVGGEQAVAYCASKGALVLMTKAMALDHARDGVRINAVCPGDTDTPMIEREPQRCINLPGFGNQAAASRALSVSSSSVLTASLALRESVSWPCGRISLPALWIRR